MDKNTGGPAFPVLHSIDGNWVREPLKEFQGMTLRDYFAATAPVTIADAVAASGLRSTSVYSDIGVMECLTSDENRAVVFSVLAMLRGEYADAMIANHVACMERTSENGNE